MCLFFYVIGNLLRESQLVLRLLKNGMDHKFYSVLTGVFLIASSYFYACIAHPQWTDILSFFDVWMQTACFMAIAGLMFMSKVIEKSVIGRVLMYLGKNTMIIFAIHVIIISLCSTYLKPVISNFTLYKSLSFILVFGISIGIVPLVNRYLPILAGKGESR